MLKPTVGMELSGVGGQTGRHEADIIDLLYGKFSTLASIASAIFRLFRLWVLPQELAGERSCLHFADQSSLHPSLWP